MTFWFPPKFLHYWTCQATLARALSPRLRFSCRDWSSPSRQRRKSQSSLPAPQAVNVEEAPPGSLDSSFRYWLEAEEIPEVNAVIAVDACTQYSRPGSAAASPCPLVGVRIEAIITGAKPVFQAARHLPPSQSPPPPPLPPVYQDSTPCVRRRPPQSLIIRRPRTRSSPTDKPLLEPLLLDRY